MRRYLLYTVFCFTALVSCHKADMPEESAGKDTGVQASDGSVVPSCVMESAGGASAGIGTPMTRAMIGGQTVSSVTANFIKVDETAPQTWTGKEEYDHQAAIWPSYTDAQIVEAEVISSADNTDFHFRQISFNPRLLYSFTVKGTETDIAYVSRMVGWHPVTYDVPAGVGGSKENATVLFREADCMKMVDGKVCVEFRKKLDGQTDIMMTDMREGRMYVPGFRNNDDDLDVQPYGHMYDNPMNTGIDGLYYCNYFTFRHYLSAIRIFVTDENEHGGGAMPWGQINNIKILDQPGTVVIELPQVQSRGAYGDPSHVPGTTPSLPSEGVSPVFGDAVSWGDYADLDLVRTPMFSDNGPDESYEEASALPIVIPNKGSLGDVYAGYALVKPYDHTDASGTKMRIRIFTDAGTYDVSVPRKVTHEGREVNVLEPGYIYDVNINISDIGGLEVVIRNDDADKYSDLTPYNEEYGDYEYSNCFVITRDRLKMTETKAYDGFFFRPDVPGRGGKGDVSYDHYASDASLSPVFAKILYQDGNRPIEHVEMVQGFVRFTLNPKSTLDALVPGNAIIAVYNEAGDIIWSWHIWVCDSIDPKTVGGVTVLSKNLGAVYSPAARNDVTPSDDQGKTRLLNTYGMYYQWGRKDPTTGPMEWNYEVVDMRTAPYYTLDGIRNDVSEVYLIGNAPQISHSVESPLVILAPSDISVYYSSDWLFTPNDNLWRDDRKTIYDPCPFGYKVPSEDDLIKVLSVFSTNEYGTYGAYDTSSGLFFPYAGWKGDDVNRVSRTHAWMKVGLAGDYQTSTINPSTMHRRRNLITPVDFTVELFGGSSTPNTYRRGSNPYDMNRTAASVVRCVRYSEEPSSL